jgi:hypothetical protein
MHAGLIKGLMQAIGREDDSSETLTFRIAISELVHSECFCNNKICHQYILYKYPWSIFRGKSAPQWVLLIINNKRLIFWLVLGLYKLKTAPAAILSFASQRHCTHHGSGSWAAAAALYMHIMFNCLPLCGGTEYVLMLWRNVWLLIDSRDTLQVRFPQI